MQEDADFDLEADQPNVILNGVPPGELKSDSDWESDIENADQVVYANDPDHWVPDVLQAVKKGDAILLESLLDQPRDRTEEIRSHSDEFVRVTAKVISERRISKDLQSALEMLLFLTVEKADPVELMLSLGMIFEGLFCRPTAECIRFFIPSIKATLFKVQSDRLFSLALCLTELDNFIGNPDWNGITEEDGYDGLIKLHCLICDFVSPFVERVAFGKPIEFNPPDVEVFTTEREEGERMYLYRKVLSRSLLHLLSSPVGDIPADYENGFASFRRIVGLIGALVPDYRVFSKWSDSEKGRKIVGRFRYEDDEDGVIRKVPIADDSIFRLAFLINVCGLQPNHFPTPLSAEYFFLEIVVKYADMGDQLNLRMTLDFLEYLLPKIPDESIDFEESGLKPFIADELFFHARNCPSEKSRRRLYFIIRSVLRKLTTDSFLTAIKELWHLLTDVPAAQEVLVLEFKSVLLEHLQTGREFSRRRSLEIFKLFLAAGNCRDIRESSRLIVAILGIFTVAVAKDPDDRSGIFAVIAAVFDMMETVGKSAKANVDEREEKAKTNLPRNADQLKEMENETEEYGTAFALIETAVDILQTQMRKALEKNSS